jgi:cell division protein FtsZ
MTNEIVDFKFPKLPEARIKVIGIGGGGSNAVNHMYKMGIKNVDFVICNTDSQALEASPVQNRVQLGASLTEGRGAGNKPEVGKQAAIENIEDVKAMLSNKTEMVFITAGMGGGTGTGGAPVIAKACNDLGYLTVGIVTIPFRSEGKRRIKQAIEGITELEEFVDSILIINNERIREMYGDLGVSQAFAKADDVLAIAAKGIAEIITIHSNVNVDMADVTTVMRKGGLTIMGTGTAKGTNRAEEALEQALHSPLLNNSDIRGAKQVLININSGPVKELTMDELGRIQDNVQSKAGFEADLIWGQGIDENLGEEISVTIVATGFSQSAIQNMKFANMQERIELSDIFRKDPQPANPVENQKTNNLYSPNTSANSKANLLDFDPEFESLYPNTSRERVKTKTISFAEMPFLNDELVEEMEKVPAYKRRNIRMNDPRYTGKDFSSYFITRDNKISQNKFFAKKPD